MQQVLQSIHHYWFVSRLPLLFAEGMEKGDADHLHGSYNTINGYKDLLENTTGASENTKKK